MKKLMIITGLSIAVASCYNDKGDKLYPVPPVVTCDTTVGISYKNDIQPILTANCTLSGCHDPSGAAASGGYDFTTYASLKTAATNGLLLGDIRWDAGHNAMPKGLPKLSDCNINKISRWIDRGANNN